jgi:hypothetical protein
MCTAKEREHLKMVIRTVLDSRGCNLDRIEALGLTTLPGLPRESLILISNEGTQNGTQALVSPPGSCAVLYQILNDRIRAYHKK